MTGTRGPMSIELPLCAPRLRTDLHSPAGVRSKFRHSLEHIVPGKEPRLPGKELRPAGLPLPSQARSSRASPGRGVQASHWGSRSRTATSSTPAASGSAIQPRGGRAERKGGGSACAMVLDKHCACARLPPSRVRDR